MSPGGSSPPAEDDAIRLRVESISGQVLHLRVPRTETVLGLKHRIFAKQGIPVAEQNLMFLEEELRDFRTLEECNIRDSCTVRLSVGMKGGPINTRRTLYLDDRDTIATMANMLAANDISVVLVPHNGAYHVIPVPSEKRSSSDSSSASGAGPSGASSASGSEARRRQHSSLMDGSLSARSEENAATKNKMAALQKQLKKKRAAPSDAPATTEQQQQQRLHQDELHNLQQPASPSSLVAPLLSRPAGACAGSSLQKGLDGLPPTAAAPVLVSAACGGDAPTHTKMVVPRLLASQTPFSLNMASAGELSATNRHQTQGAHLAAVGGGGGGGAAFESSSSYGSGGMDRNLVIYPSAGRASGHSAHSGHHHHHHHHHPAGGHHPSTGQTIFVSSPYNGLFRCTADTTENTSKEDVSSGSGRCSSAAAAPPPADNTVVPTVVDRPAPAGNAHAGNQSNGSSTASAQGGAAAATSGPAAGVNAAKQLLQQAANTIQQQKQQQQQDDNAAGQSAKDEAKAEVKEDVSKTEAVADKKSASSAAPSDATSAAGAAATAAAAATATTTSASDSAAASPAAPPKKKHPRCATCNKKTGLASSYTCRCGGNFCATHRYAEAHDCGHDYKSEGRQQLEKSNPLIQAAKLHKI